VLAAGGGDRFGTRKQFEMLDGRAVVHWSLRTAEAAGCRTVAVVPHDVAVHPRRDATITVAGGRTRAASVRAGLAAVPVDASVVVVHDAARPLAPLELWRRVIDEVLAGAAAVVPVVELADSVRWCDGPPLDRTTLRLAQTPQAFDPVHLRQAHAAKPEASDDASLFVDVVMVAGAAVNVKITHPDDLAVVAALRRTACASRS
jgi:2-C-methyl-D-erythritol 4-phosphate cytidylyltransferase